MDKCQAGVDFHGNHKGHVVKCNESCVQDRMYCDLHYREALTRVALVSPVDTIRGRALPVLEKPR